MAGLPDGLRGGCGDDHRASHRLETKYHGGASTSFLSDTGEREEDAAPAGVADLLRGAAALLGTDHPALSGDGVVDIRDPAADADGPLHD